MRDEVVPRLFNDVPVEVLVGGDTAYNVDYLNQTTFYTPIVFLLVLGLSFVLRPPELGIYLKNQVDQPWRSRS